MIKTPSRIPLLFCFLFLNLISNSQTTNEAPKISTTGNRGFCIKPNESIQVFQSVSITDADDTTIDEVSVQISSNYDNGNDLLTLTGTHANITETWNVTEGQLSLKGPATLTEFETAIEDIYYSRNIGPSTSKQFSVVLGNAFFLPSTGHYYIYVESIGIRWDNARDAAAASTFFGLEGYLATLTSTEESVFTGEQVTGTGWIGATDDAVEGEWRWVTGPEAGTLFWNGNQNGSVVAGEFEFWNNGEPNDFPNDNIDGQENFAHITAPNIGIQNSWNDLPISGSVGAFRAEGYVVEFGGLPSDVPTQLSDTVTLEVHCTVITNRSITIRASK